MVLKRNPNWDRSTDPVRTAQPDTIVYTMGLDPTVINQRLIADQGKDRNAVSSANVPASLLPKVLGDPAVTQRLATSPSGALSYLAINVTHAPLNNLQVRQALEYAVNKKAVQVAAGGAKIGGELATTLITPGIPGYQSYDKYPAGPTGDPAKAKSLLSQAGHASGLSLTLLTQNDSIHLAEAQAVQSGLTAAGINVRLKPEDSDSFYADAGASQGRLRPGAARLAAGLPERDRQHPAAVRLQPDRQRQLQLQPLQQPGGGQADRAGQRRDRPGRRAGAVGPGRPDDHGRRAGGAAAVCPQRVPARFERGELLRPAVPAVHRHAGGRAGRLHRANCGFPALSLDY